MALESKPLFHPEVLREQVRRYELPPRREEWQPKLDHWAEFIGSGRADAFRETDLLPDFISDVFCGFLGYTRPTTQSEVFTLSRERHVEVDGQVADAVIGRFGKDKEQFAAVLEGKGTRDPLDRPFAGRRMSAVDQAYRYAINLPCDWIIVTSMRETRLYYKGAQQNAYERFETPRLAADELLLRRFGFLLGAERVVPPRQECHLTQLLKASELVGRKLTNDFYARYAEIRQALLARLRRVNPGVAAGEVLACTQKLLDRVLFCAFCEDRMLLPPDSLRHAFEHRDPYNPRPLWHNFQGLFRAIDEGNTGLNIPAYNGGLFAADPVIDSLVVPDEVCTLFKELGDYDYRPPRQVAESEEDTQFRAAVDVDILGHIFEQSITDLEKLRQRLDSGEIVPEKQAGKRRKQEGAFYTPAFITRYIVEQALGGVVKERFEALRKRHEAEASGTARKPLEDPRAYDLSALNDPQRKALIRFWEAWQEQLKNLRILDTACGSGAFLIEAFDQLHAFFEASNARLEELRGQRTLFDLDRQILQNNLYGVDINAEAIQICQLSLWIKTAARGRRLTSLDYTIREGNSVISDPAVHPKAFNWQAAFPGVFAQGGFDVVLGNPPYIRQELLAPYKSYWEQRFKSYHGVADIFVYFFEQGIEVLMPGGKLAFITSGSWVRGNFGAPLRKFLSAGVKLESMVDFGEFQPFEDAEMIRPSITVLSKNAPGGEMRVFKWLTSGKPPETLTEEIGKAPAVSTCGMGSDTWELESTEVINLREQISTRGTALGRSGSELYRGILSGLTDAFVVSEATRNKLINDDPSCAEILKPFAQGTHLRPWYIEESKEFLITIPSSANREWPWTKAGDTAERIFGDTYPSVFEHLAGFRDAAMRRTDQGEFWWELRSCAYWDVFAQPKIVWPDISKRPRFSMDVQNRYLGNTGYVIPGGDYYLLGVLSSWATWFFISKTAQPLRLRGDRWQYRLIAQFMEKVPIPDAAEADREAIATLARQCCSLGEERYRGEVSFRRRLEQTFNEGSTNPINQKAQAWWELSLNELGDALKQSFNLRANPLKKPRAADEWEPYLQERKDEHDRLTRQLDAAEADLNDRVYGLFNLSAEEIKVLQKEVEH